MKRFILLLFFAAAWLTACQSENIQVTLVESAHGEQPAAEAVALATANPAANPVTAVTVNESTMTLVQADATADRTWLKFVITHPAFPADWQAMYGWTLGSALRASDNVHLTGFTEERVVSAHKARRPGEFVLSLELPAVAEMGRPVAVEFAELGMVHAPADGITRSEVIELGGPWRFEFTPQRYTARTGLIQTGAALEQDIVVTHLDDDFPPRCGPGDLALTILRWMDAFNRGDQTQLASFFDPHTFGWYSLNSAASPGEGVNNFLSLNPASGLMAPAPGRYDDRVVGHQDTLLPFLAKRHEYGERMRLVAVEVNYLPERYSYGGYVVFTRQASDLDADADGQTARRFASKMEISCDTQTIIVWSGGEDKRATEPSAVCPPPIVDVPSDAVLACSSG